LIWSSTSKQRSKSV